MVVVGVRECPDWDSDIEVGSQDEEASEYVVGSSMQPALQCTVGGSMVYINNNQLASKFVQLLSGDGQTIDTDNQRPADTVMTSMQSQKSIGNVLGRPFHSLGTALLAARQIQEASNSAKHVWTPGIAQHQSFPASPSSEDDPVCVA